MGIKRLVGCLWCVPSLIACGSVMARPDADTDRASDAPSTDAGAARFTRVFHKVPQGQVGNLFATDITDGSISQAKLLSGTTANATATPNVTGISGDANTLIYTSDAETENVFELYFVRFTASGPSQPVKLNRSHGGTDQVVSSALSPDGSHAVYSWGSSSEFVTYYSNFYFVDLSGAIPGAPIPISSGSKHTYGVMSPDGSRFAYVDNSTTSCGVYVVALTSAGPTTPRRINGTTTSSTACHAPLFSPDGTRVAFVADSAIDGVHELWMSNTSTMPPTIADKVNGALVAGGDVVAGLAGSPLHKFSPDSNRLAYLADATTDEVTELWIADVSGPTPMTARKVNDALVAGGDVSDGSTGVLLDAPFSFSADGKRLVYTADQRTDGVLEAFVVDVSSSTPGVPQRVTGTLVAGGNARLPIFARDGSGLAYVADQRSDDVVELFYVDLRGTPGAPQVVNGDLGPNGDIRNSGLSFAIAFSPDGKKLAFVADQMTDTYNDFFVSDVSTGTPATQLVQHSTTANGSPLQLSFTADSQTLLYTSNPTGTYDIWAAEVGGATPGAPAKVNSAPGPVSGAVSRFWLAPLP